MIRFGGFGSDVSLAPASAFLQRRPIIACIGTSSVSRSYTNSTGIIGDQYWLQGGWLTWLGAYCPQVRISMDHVKGYTGAESDVLLANIGQITGASPRAALCIVQVTSNDAGVLTVEQSVANYLAIGRALQAAGIIPLYLLQHPTTATSAGTSRDVSFAVRERIRRFPAILPGSFVADMSLVTYDRTVTGFSCIAAYDDDGTHLNALGAMIVGRDVLKPVIDTLFPPGLLVPPVVSDVDVYSANNPFGSLNSNPTMLGTGGSASGAFTGTIATSYTASGSLSGLTVTGSKVNVNGVTRQRFTFSGTAGATNLISFDRTFASGAIESLVSGDKVELSAKVIYSGVTTNCPLTSARVNLISNGDTDLKRFFNTETTRNFPDLGTLTLRTPPYQAQGAVTAGTSPGRVFFNFISGTDYTGLVIDIEHFVMRKLPADWE